VCTFVSVYIQLCYVKAKFLRSGQRNDSIVIVCIHNDGFQTHFMSNFSNVLTIKSKIYTLGVITKLIFIQLLSSKLQFAS